MLNRRTQIVIGIAIIIIAAAFLLVGVYFAQLQGVLFQNGADSLQLFANNLAAAKNALYIAPSTMSITLAGNNSLCSWDSAIDSYDCSGGSKIYNVSYASGPTLDTGTSTFSVALCFILTIGPPGGSEQKAGAEAVDVGTETALRDAADAAEIQGINSIIDQQDREIASVISSSTGGTFASTGGGTFASSTLSSTIGTTDGKLVGAELSASSKFAVEEPTSYSEIVNSYMGKVYKGVKAAASFYSKHKVAFNNLIYNLGLPAFLFWFGMNGPSIVKNVESGASVVGQAVKALNAPSQSVANLIASSYDTGSGVQQSNAAANLQLQEYTQVLNSSGDISTPITTVQAYNAAQTLIGDANLDRDLLNQLGQYASTPQMPPNISGFNSSVLNRLQLENAAVNASRIMIQVTNLLLQPINIQSINTSAWQPGTQFSCSSTRIASGGTVVCNIFPVAVTQSTYQLSININYTMQQSGGHAWSNGTISGALESGNVAFVPLTSSSPYSTPEGGVSVPSTLSSSYSFTGKSVGFSSPIDPVLSSVGFLASKSFMVYGQTASCIGTIPPGITLNNALSIGASLYGQVSSIFEQYNKVNVVAEVGTYFVGYGGEVYVNGKSNGLPTMAGAPVISDLSDLCGIATTTAKAGQNLKTLVFPSAGGDISFSLTQGMYNTICSSADQLYPKTFSSFVDEILNTKQTNTDVSVLLPPQYAIGITNSSTDSNICLYRLILDSYGNPVYTISPLYQSQEFSGSQLSSALSKKYMTEYGIPVTCVDINNITEGRNSLVFTEGANGGPFNISKNVNVNSFFLNNQAQVGFSVSPQVYPNQLTITQGESSTFQAAENFIGGPPIVYNQAVGVDSPALQLFRFVSSNKGFQDVVNGLQISGNNVIDSMIINYIANDIGNTNLSYYPTDYTNVTFNVHRAVSGGKTVFSIGIASNNLVFGVYPNSYNSLGGTYVNG